MMVESRAYYMMIHINPFNLDCEAEAEYLREYTLTGIKTFRKEHNIPDKV